MYTKTDIIRQKTSRTSHKKRKTPLRISAKRRLLYKFITGTDIALPKFASRKRATKSPNRVAIVANKLQKSQIGYDKDKRQK